MPDLPSYPIAPEARTRWILGSRSESPPKNLLDTWIPYAFLQEVERSAIGPDIPTATIFLTNRECPYRCVMCDLWRNTLDTRVPNGAIASQIKYALERLPVFTNADPDLLGSAQIKLYNAGSFFDPGAIPPEDYSEIAAAVAGFGRVVVECHPSLVGPRTFEFRKLLTGRLEVAIGLETAHNDVLDKLNKRFTLEDFRAAAERLAENAIDLRVFLLLNPPFLPPEEGVEWAKRSLDFAFDCGATTCCIIPTRAGNGAMERLAAEGQFAPPTLNALEEATEYGIRLDRGRVFADLWDADQFYSCACSAKRSLRLEIMNRTQTVPMPVVCEFCSRKSIQIDK